MKTNHKTMRITDEALSYIEQFTGSSFNDKVNNMIDYFQNSQSDLEKKLETINNKIKNRQNDLSELTELSKDIWNKISELKNLYFEITLK